MPTMQHTLILERAPQAVFAALTAFDRIPEWIPGIDRAYQLTAGAAAPGSTFVEEFRMLGRHMRIIGTVTALEPQRTLSYRYDAGPIPGHWEYRISREADHTRLEFKLEMPSGGFFSTSNPLLFPLIEREIRKNLGSFKSWVERQSVA
jgi:uncharacterized protein YndB with AHSA1/START domain